MQAGQIKAIKGKGVTGLEARVKRWKIIGDKPEGQGKGNNREREGVNRGRGLNGG